jgi:RNA polymerase sigma-70 factor (ECF subfamily)
MKLQLMFESPTDNSRSLVRRIGEGDPSAEDELIRAYLPRVIAFAMVRSLDRELARELAQDVMIGVLCALREARVREADKLSAFVYGTARNLLNDRIRKRAQEKLDPLPPGFDLVQAAVDSEDSDRLAAAHKAIESLDASDRRILLLTLVDGMKPADICNAVGLSSEVVRQRKSRALKKVIEIVRLESQRPPLPRLQAVEARQS